MEEQRLFRVPTGYATIIRLERDGGWTLVVDFFYEGEPWTELDRARYGDLSLRELTDVLLCELFTARTQDRIMTAPAHESGARTDGNDDPSTGLTSK